MPDGSANYDSDSKISMEDTFVKHFMYALDKLQSTWMSPDSFDESKFNMQLLYLIRIMPNKAKQKEVIGLWAQGSKDLDESELNLDKKEKSAYAGMAIVTEIVMFICEAFELINTDITGPATTKEYMDAVIEIPDMPSDFVADPDTVQDGHGPLDDDSEDKNPDGMNPDEVPPEQDEAPVTV